MERNGHVREASSIRFDGINRLFRRALVIEFARLIAREAIGDAADKHRKLQLSAE